MPSATPPTDLPKDGEAVVDASATTTTATSGTGGSVVETVSRPLPQTPSRNVEMAMARLRALKVPFISSSSPGFEVLVGTYNQRIGALPAIIVFAKSVEQVRDCVNTAVDAGLKINARGGGHSYTALGQGGENGHLVVDVSALDKVLVDPVSNVATVGAGARLGRVAMELYSQGERAIAHGSCPGVGLAGHMLHGGYGWIAHNKGLSLDWLVGANVVLASGVEVYCSRVVNPDLFWALRGAGSDFAIAIKFKLATFKAPTLSVPFNVCLDWKTEQKKLEGLEAFVKFAKNCPAKLNMRLTAHHSGGHSFDGVYYGPETELFVILEPLLKQTGGLAASKTGTWLEGLEFFAEGNSLAIKQPYNEMGNFYATSMMLPDLADASLRNFVAYWQNKALDFKPGGWFFQVDIHGGAHSELAAVPVDETAYAHRDKLLLVQLYHYTDTLVAPYPPQAVALLKGWVETTTAPLGEGEWGMYANYPDSELDRDMAGLLYYGQNLPRLKQLKKRFDPTEVFSSPQSITPAK